MKNMRAACWVLSGTLLFVGSCRDDPPPPVASPAAPLASALVEPAGPQEQALLDGLTVGDDVEGFRVQSVSGVRADGTIAIVLRRDEDAVAIAIAKRAEQPRPPAMSDKYAVYYERSAEGREAGQAECVAVANAVAARIAAVENKVPMPPGMRALREVAQPL